MNRPDQHHHATPGSVSVRRPSELAAAVLAGPHPAVVLRAAADWIDTEVDP